MPDLLLELFSEEIPARMQRKAAGDLKKMITDGLVDAGLTYEAATAHWTPRRLTLDIRGLTLRSKDVREEIKGPSTSAPEQAVQGFLRKAGLSDVSQAHIHTDPKKGDFYIAHLVKEGRSAEAIIADLVPAVIRSFPWPKSMRWGKVSGPKGSIYGGVAGQGGEALRWIRPLQSILCVFGPETEETKVIDFEIGGIKSGNVTYGHRFMSDGAPIAVRRFDDYVEKLEKAFVVLDAERRKEIILSDARNLSFASGLELVEDDGLLEEVSGLVEWPVVLMGEFEDEFLSIPSEVIRLTIRANQKCFVTRKSGEADSLSNKFILVSNIAAQDEGKIIAAGNGKVVRARLSDALYFWQTDQADLTDLNELTLSAEKLGLDLKKPLDQRMARLDNLGVTFHAKLGTQGARVLRIKALAQEIAALIGADPKLAGRAAILAKADLQTEVVGEFPEVQGAMGRKYALLQGENASVSAAIEEHYKPQGPSDFVPNDPVSVAVALADKLDTLVGFWAINEKPTGSKDPYALRRAALGVIRLILDNDVRVSLISLFYEQRNIEIQKEASEMRLRIIDDILNSRAEAIEHLAETQILKELPEVESLHLYTILEEAENADRIPALTQEQAELIADAYVSRFTAVEYQANMGLFYELLSFFHERFKVYLKDEGARHDAIDAVLSQDADNLLMVARRLEALIVFINTEDGENLLAGTKRAANILAAEEKKKTQIADVIDASLFVVAEENALYEAIIKAQAEAEKAISAEDYSGAMLALAQLREPVDAFFDKVMVNDDNEAIRANRLALLLAIRNATAKVADFSKING